MKRHLSIPQLNNPDWLRQAYESKSTQAIADEFGVCRNTVRNRMIEFGIIRRTSGGHFKGVPKPVEQRQKMAAARKRYWQQRPNRDLHRLKVSAALTKHGIARGYRRIFTLHRGRIREHILIAETMLGRKLRPNEQVHHKDENKLNNHPDNLEVLTNSEHQRLHMATRQRDPKTGRLLKST